MTLTDALRLLPVTFLMAGCGPSRGFSVQSFCTCVLVDGGTSFGSTDAAVYCNAIEEQADAMCPAAVQVADCAEGPDCRCAVSYIGQPCG